MALSKNNLSRLLFFCSIAFAILGLIAFLVEANLGLTLFEFADETEKFVAAQMIGSGMHLYSDIFAHHGPVPYIISHIYTKLVSPSDFTQIRWFVVLLALLSAGSIYLSPSLKSSVVKLWAVGIFLSILSSIWILQGIHMILYYQIGGFLLVLPVMQFFIPVFVGDSPTKCGVFASGLAMTISCFTSYTFGLSSVLLIIAVLIPLLLQKELEGLRQLAGPFVLGISFAFAFLLIWIFYFADLKGYLIYHFYFNQIVYASFIKFNLAQLKNFFTLSFHPESIIHSFVLISAVFWIYVLAHCRFKIDSKRFSLGKILALLFFLLFVISLNPRGQISFRDAAFVILNISLFAFACAFSIQETGKQLKKIAAWVSLSLVSIFLFEQASRNSVATPYGVSKKEFKYHHFLMKPSEENIFKFIRLITKPDGAEILALVFNPSFYIKAGRLPASGHFYYLPWQAAYSREPVGNYKIDICKDIESGQPSVIWFDNPKIWNRHQIDQYEPCITSILEKMYLPFKKGSTFHFRADLLKRD